MSKQTYKFIKEKSILANLTDEYDLTENEFYKLYSFFVTYSLSKKQSGKSRNFKDYGWSDNTLNATCDSNVLEDTLESIIDLSKKNFVFTEKNNLKEQFQNTNLSDGKLDDCDTERMVIAKTDANNKYLKLFYRIRNCFAHGRFVLKYSSNLERMLIMQDNDRDNVTGRIVISLSTLLNFVDEIDKTHIVNKVSEKKTNEQIKEETVA